MPVTETCLSSPTPSHHRDWRSALVVFRIHDNRTPFSFAGAFGAEVGVIAHGEVDHAAFAGGHRRKLIRLAGLAHAFGGDFGCEFQLLGSQRLEIHAIEAELV